jgi:ketosteroid isomerase-like protein
MMCFPAFVVAIVGVVMPAATVVQSPDAQLAALDARWARAYVVHDTTFALELFHEAVVVTSSNGRVKSRDEELADIRSTPGLVVHDFKTTDVRIRVHGATGVVTGLAEWSFTMSDRTSHMRRRYTATYARGGPHKWQMVALHLGPAPATP